MILMKNRLKLNIKVFLVEAILKRSYLREHFWKCVFWGSSFENNFLENVVCDLANLKMFFFEGATFKIPSFWRNNFDEYLSWLLTGVTADWDEYWLGWLLIGVAAGSSKLRFWLWFIWIYGISIFIHLNLDYSFDSPKLTGFQFWFI